MTTWQIGISDIVTEEIHWQDDYVTADSIDEAYVFATKKGYYRNVRLVEVNQ